MSCTGAGSARVALCIASARARSVLYSVSLHSALIATLLSAAAITEAQGGASTAQLIWAQTGYPGRADILRTLVAQDSKGGAVVVGSGYAAPEGSSGPGTVAAQVAVRFHADGSPAWTSRFTPLTSIRTWVTVDGLALDSRDDAYAVGTVYNPTAAGGPNEDIVVQKIDASGHRLWADMYDAEGELGSLDVAAGLALDGHGGVAVLGTSQMTSGTTVHRVLTVIRYDAQGQRTWIRHYADPVADVEAVCICPDRSGGFYAVGNARSLTSATPVTVHYDVTGAESWEARPSQTVATVNNQGVSAVAATVDRQGALYICVNGLDNPNSFTCLKYGHTGVLAWRLEESLPANRLLAFGIALDTRGNVIAGSTVYNGRSAYAATVIGPDGRRRWTSFDDSRKKESLIGSAMAVDGAGDVYITGLALSSNGAAHKQYTVKFGPSGDTLWSFGSGSLRMTMTELPSIAAGRSQTVAITGIASWWISNGGASVLVRNPTTYMIR